MFIKWIICEAGLENREAFSLAQEQWVRTATAEGFIAQAGGWNLKNESEACIIAFWESEEHLKQFMDKLHDEIFLHNKQGNTYESIAVTHFESQMTMEGRIDSLKEMIKLGEVLRVADCFVKAGKISHFEKVQREIWKPEMKRAKGMLGGKFSKAASDEFRYLVTTFWASLEYHSHYVDTILPSCQERSDVMNDTEKVTGYLVSLVESWKIIGQHS